MATSRKNIEPDYWLHVAIDSWSWDYYLGTALRLKGLESDPDPLGELRRLVINGTTVKGNRRSVAAGLQVEIRIFHEVRFRKENRSGNSHLVDVGRLDRVKGGYECLIIMPDDALPLVMLMLVHGRYGHMNIAAIKEGRLTGRVQSYEFAKAMTVDWD